MIEARSLSRNAATCATSSGVAIRPIAVLAHISTEYYVGLEQARAPRPSTDVLAGIAGAPHLTDAESDHLHLLAGTAPARRRRHEREVRPSILALLERLPDTAGIVLSVGSEVLALLDPVAELRAGSAQFARLWELRDVQPAPVLTKSFTHPVVGPVTVDCDTLHLADRDQSLVLYTAPAGSRSGEALAFLASLGHEGLTSSHPAARAAHSALS